MKTKVKAVLRVLWLFLKFLAANREKKSEK
jgi:hypothetical protein